MSRATRPLVSVIVPVHNAESFVAGTIATVLHQDLADLELIAVDDASADLSPCLLRRASARDARVRVLTQDRNRGVVPGRNRGIEHAQGAWLAFLDADDVWLPQKLSHQLAYARTLDPSGNQPLGIGTRAAYIGRRRGPIGTIGSVGDVTSSVSRAGPLPFCLSSFLVSRDAVIDIGGFDPAFNRIGGQDYDLMVRLARADVRLHALTERLTWYRLHGSSISASYHQQQLRTADYIADRTLAEDRGGPVPVLDDYLVDDDASTDADIAALLRGAAIEMLDGSLLRGGLRAARALAREPRYVAGKLASRLPATGRNAAATCGH